MSSKIACIIIGIAVFFVSACSSQIPVPLLSKSAPIQTESPPLPEENKDAGNPAAGQTPSLQDTPVETKTPDTPYIEQPVTGQPTPDGVSMQRSRVTLESVELLQKESFPKQITLELSGFLPTPCHQVKAEVHQPDTQNRIEIDVYSLADPNVFCVQVLAPFELHVELGSYPAGKYRVVINAEERGHFEMP